MEIEDRDLIINTAIFGGLDVSTIDFLTAGGGPIRRQAGEEFFSEGDSGQSVFVLRSGRVTVGKNWNNTHVILRDLRRGDCFGEMAILDLGARSATVTAYDDSTAFEIPLTRLQDLFERNPEQYHLIHMNMAREVSRRLRKADDRLFELAMCQPDLEYDRLYLYI